MVQPAIQLFTLRDVDRPIEAKIRSVGETNFRGVELAGLDGSTPTDVADALEAENLDVVGAHVGVEELESEYDDVVETYDALDCSRLVIPSYEAAAFETKRGVDRAADRLSDLADRLAADGFDLLYHNHTFEFTDLDGETAMDRFVRKTSDRVGVELDTGLAKHAGADPARLIRAYGDRVSLVHLTDTRRGSESTVHVELGGGEVDLSDCIDAACDVGAEWGIYEHGRTTDPMASLAHSDSALAERI